MQRLHWKLYPEGERIYSSSTGYDVGILSRCYLVISDVAYKFLHDSWNDYHSKRATKNESILNHLNEFLREAKTQSQEFLYWSQTNDIYNPVQEVVAVDIKNEKIYVKVKNATRGVSFINMCSYSDIAKEPSKQELKQKFGNERRDLEFFRKGTSLKYLLPKKE